MKYQTLLTDTDQGICMITINRPDKMNALNKTVITELGEAIRDVYSNPEIRGAIITGAGNKAFVAGADISEFLELDASGGEALARRGQEMVFSAIENCPKPILAAVNGYALGGGCELAMACHFRLSTEQAKFGQPEVNLGLIPGYGGTQRLTQLVGKGRAMEMMMSGNMIDGTEAHRIGLVNQLAPEEELVPKTHALLSMILQKAPLALSEIIQLVNKASIGHTDGLEAEIKAFGKLFDTADAKEGAAAFLEKRKAHFTGK